jgi:D-alanyl-D-alanine carboxypeptidase (penicillin-binding protein 5/6)
LPDVSTARDLARLARELVKRSDILKYSSTVKRGFRNHTMDMMNHNRLLGTVEGCDGLKTGYFLAAGYSIVATAQRGGRRVIAVVLGSKSRSVRDAAASRLLAESFARLPPLTPEAGEAVAAARPPATGEKGAVRAAPADTPREGAPRRGWRRTAKFVTVVVALLAIAGYIQRRRDLGGLSGYGPGSGAKKK